MNKKLSIILLFFFLSRAFIFSSSASIITRRVLTPKTPSLTTEPWADFLTRIVRNITEIDAIYIEPSITDEAFEALRQLRISPSEPAFRKLARHLFFQLNGKAPEEYQLNPLTSLIYFELRQYEFKECINRNGPMVTYQKRQTPVFTTGRVNPYYLELEGLLLDQQRKDPASEKVYRDLEELYRVMIEEYPGNLRLWWQLSWIYGCLGQHNERRIHFFEGAKQDIQNLPLHTSRYKTALYVTSDVRKKALISWGSYVESEYEFLRMHALKYYLQFPEIFMPEGKPISVDTEAFEETIKFYDRRAREILRSESGVAIYAFTREGAISGEEPLRYLAYDPATLEVVGFRIMCDERGLYTIAIDTFYRASKGMIDGLRDEEFITLLINTQGKIAVGRDDQEDIYRKLRVEEQLAEFELFELDRAMYQPALDKIKERILSYPDRIAVICIGGVSAAGKTPAAEIIEDFLATQHGRKVKKLNMDFYIINREYTPIIIDANGNELAKDYEHPEALNIERFRKDLSLLLAGQEVELPRYDFKSGESIAHSGVKLRLMPGDILLIEGIHALDPIFFTDTEGRAIIGKRVPTVRVAIDASEFIRFPRRVARDRQSRDTTILGLLGSIRQWEYVRMGEDKYIYPTFENADVIINTDISIEAFKSSLLYRRFREALELAYKNVGNYPEIKDGLEGYLMQYFGKIPTLP